MKDQVLCVDYFVLEVEDQPGTGTNLLRKFKNEGVNLLGTLAFPTAPGKTQVDVIPENPDAFTKAVRKLGITATGPKLAFVIQGTDKRGALADVLDRLAQKDINVRASCAVAAGGNRYASIVWVAPADVEAATRALGAQVAEHHHT